MAARAKGRPSDPGFDLLDEQDVISALRLTGPKQLKRLIDIGSFPPGIRLGAKGPVFWRTADVRAFLYLQGRGCRPGASADGVGSRDDEEVE